MSKNLRADANLALATLGEPGLSPTPRHRSPPDS